MNVHHIAIQIANNTETINFYTQTLGFRITRQQAHSIWLDAHGTILMLEFCTTPQTQLAWKSPVAGLHLLAFAIGAEERAFWRSRLQQAQVPIESETEYTLYFRDPEGNRLALSHYPENK
jgi:glyoxylase I family protein